MKSLTVLALAAALMLVFVSARKEEFLSFTEPAQLYNSTGGSNGHPLLNSNFYCYTSSSYSTYCYSYSNDEMTGTTISVIVFGIVGIMMFIIVACVQ